jgi:hypothetical protein
MMGDKEDSHGFGDVWRMDDSNQNGGHICTKTAIENPNNPKLKGSRISTRSTNNEDEGNFVCHEKPYFFSQPEMQIILSLQ